MPQLSTLDLAIVAVYILGMTLLGVWFTRAQKDLLIAQVEIEIDVLEPPLLPFGDLLE